MATTTSRDGRSLALVAMLALPSMGYAFSMAGRTVVTPSSALRRPQYRPVMMADPGDVQGQIAALQQQLEMIKLQAQIKELEAKSAAQAPLPVEAPQPVAAVPEIATIPPPAVVVPEIAPEVFTAPVYTAPVYTAPMPDIAAVAPPAAAVQSMVPAVPDAAAAAAAAASSGGDQIAALQKQIEIIQLQQQIKALELNRAASAPLPLEAPPPAVVVPQIAPEVYTAPVYTAPAVTAPVYTAPMPDIAAVTPPAAAVQSMVPAVPDAAAAAAAVASSGGDPPYLAIAVGVLVLVPSLYFGGTKFVSFVNERYDELQGTEGAEGAPQAASPSFAPRAPGNQAANRMWSEREADAEAMRAMSWDAPEVRTRNAREIFFEGIENLMAEPQGWLFGAPSPLYSNAPSMSAPSTPSAPAAPLQEMSANFAAPPVAPTPVAPAPVAPAPVAAPPVAAPYVAPTAAAPAPTAAVPDMPAPAPMAGRVIPSGSKGMTKGKRAARRKARAERVPPSTPEEVASARAGEYDYGQSPVE